MSDREPIDQIPQEEILDNLPMVIKTKGEEDLHQKAIDEAIGDLKTFQEESEQYSKIESLADFVERYVSANTRPKVIKSLSRLINTLRDNHGQLIDSLESIKDIKKDRRNNDKDRDIYLQEQVSLKLFDRAINENQQAVDLLEQIVAGDKKALEETSQLETKEIKDPQQREMAENMKTNNQEVQVATTAEYQTLIESFTEDKAKLMIHKAVIEAHTKIQEPLIQAEYYERANKIRNMFEGSTLVEDLPDGLQRSLFNQPGCNFLYGKIFEFHKFDLGNLIEYPNYQAICRFLSASNFWIKRIYQGGFYERKDISTLTNLTNLIKKLIEDIHPDLQGEQMKETINLLEINLNKDRDFESKKKFIKKKSELELERRTGARIEVPLLPDCVTPEMLNRLESKNIELKFDPDLDFGSLEELQNLGVDEFIVRLKQRYPNLHIHGMKKVSDNSWVADQDNSYWNDVKNGSVDFPKLPGRWIAIETMTRKEFLSKKLKNLARPLKGTEIEWETAQDRYYYPFLPPEKRYLTKNTMNEIIERDELRVLKWLGLKSGEIRTPNSLEFFLFEIGSAGISWFDYDHGYYDGGQIDYNWYSIEWTNNSLNYPTIEWNGDPNYTRRLKTDTRSKDKARFRYFIVLPDK